MSRLISVGIIKTRQVKSRKIKLVTILILILSAIFFIKLFPLSEYNFYPPCPFHFLTSYYCPGCGSTRGLSGMLQGEYLAMWNNNPLVVLLIPFFLYAIINTVLQLTVDKKFHVSFNSPWFGRIFILAILLYWILRNFIPALAPID